MYKNLYRIGALQYLILFILSFLFYKERVVFADAAYHLFHILKDDDFAIQHKRYGAIVTEIFPLLCSKLSVPLEVTIRIYSVGFVIYYAACYWICGTVLKQFELALTLLLFNILFVTDTFYWIPSELPQGVAFVLVIFAILKSEEFAERNTIRVLFLLPLTVFALFFHPLLFIPTGFIIAYFLINYKLVKNKHLFFVVSAVFLLLFFLKQQLVTNVYDTKAVKSGENFIKRFVDWHSLYSTRHFVQLCYSKFIWIPICSAFIGIVYVIERKWLTLGLFALTMLTYLILVQISYPTDYTTDFYFENLYLPLGLFVAIPFVFDVLPRMQKQLTYIVFSLILCTGVTRIYFNHDVYTNRLTWERELLRTYPDKKLLIAETPGIKDTLIMTWGSPYELWLLSTTESKKKETATIQVTDSIDKLMYAHWDRKSFITTWQVISYEEFPVKYFKLSDTMSRYEIVQ